MAPPSILRERIDGNANAPVDNNVAAIASGNDRIDHEVNKRSERKRRREKQRRSDLSNAFDELSAFIVQVEQIKTPDNSGTDKKGKKRKSSDGGEDSSGITRLDLIGRALRIMKRLYRENEERKRVIAAIEGRVGVALGATNDNVIVMVPTLAPSGDDPPPVVRASYPTQSYHSTAAINSPPYYAPSATTLQQTAAPAAGSTQDLREYQMQPPLQPLQDTNNAHHTACASHWGALGGAQISTATTAGLSSHPFAAPSALRLPQYQQVQVLSSGPSTTDELSLPRINRSPNQL